MQMNGFDEDDAIDFDVFNDQTGERLGYFSLRMYTTAYIPPYKEAGAYLRASTSEGSFNIDRTQIGHSTASQCDNFSTTIFRLHS